MSRRPSAVGAVLVAFVATAAVPGPQVVAHHHAGGDHDHVHAFLVADHDDDDHERHHRAEAEHARRHLGHAHRPRVGTATHDPLWHTHVASPFQPATSPGTPAVVSAIRVTAEAPSIPRAPLVRGIGAIRSRGPPRAPRR